MNEEDNVINELLGEIAGLITQYPKALERRAAQIQTTGKIGRAHV